MNSAINKKTNKREINDNSKVNSNPKKAKTNDTKNIEVLKEVSQEIDDLFKSIKEKKIEKKEESLRKEAQDKLEYKKLKKLKAEKNTVPPGLIISPEAPIHRWDTESGLPVYKAHLLKVGEGGGTSLCPFDCDCCF